MRPLQLSLEGFTSFRREQNLDFTELDLFAITGATGAGKSSLLDALTYALYSTTARTKQVAELVSQGAETLKVRLCFAVRGTSYRVTRRWRYRPSTPVTKVLLEKQLADGSWETLESKERAANKAIAEILGMDFDTFTRAIVLPQNQFDEFLKGNTAKRREILRQLAGFEIFEKMRKQTNDLSRSLKQEVAALERQIAELEVPDAVEVELKRSQLAQLEADFPQFVQEARQAQVLLDEEERLFAQIVKLRKVREQLEALEGRSPEIEATIARLDRAIAAHELQGDWALVREIRQQVKTASSALQSASKRLAQVERQFELKQSELDAERARQAEIGPQLQAREAAIASAKVYEEQRQQLERDLAIAEKNEKEKQKQLKEAQKQLKEAQDRFDRAETVLKQANRQLAGLAPGGERLTKLQAIAPLLVEWGLVRQQLERSREQCDRAIAERETAQGELAGARSRQGEAANRLQDAREALEGAERQNLDIGRSNHAAALRMSLQPGDTCPVCGGIHPEAAALPPLTERSPIDLAPLRSREAKAQQGLQAAQAELSKAEANLDRCRQRQEEVEEQRESNAREVARLRAEIASVLGVGEDAALEVAPLQAEREALEARDAEYREGLAAQEKAAAQRSQAEQGLEFARRGDRAAQAEATAAMEARDRAREGVERVRGKLLELTEGKAYEVLVKALEREKQALGDRLQAAESAYQAVNTQLIQGRENVQQAQSALQGAIAKQEESEATWGERLEAANFDEESFLGALASAGDRAAWQQAIADYREMKVELNTRVRDLAEAIGDRTTDERAIGDRRQAKQEAEKQLAEAQERRVELGTWLQDADRKLEQGDRLAQTLETVSATYETYHTLAQSLKSNEFQAYILEHLEAELVDRATLLLRELTDARYTLRMEEGEYWVEDNWNGGELRRVRTLSGGETFAASLSMAIALSEKLSMGAELGSLFLDEGFGTLDGETLESVTQILESLRQQNRLIGVITHVKSLGERLPTQVKVYKSPQGSRLEIERL